MTNSRVSTFCGRKLHFALCVSEQLKTDSECIKKVQKRNLTFFFFKQMHFDFSTGRQEFGPLTRSNVKNEFFRINVFFSSFQLKERPAALKGITTVWSTTILTSTLCPSDSSKFSRQRRLPFKRRVST